VPMVECQCEMREILIRPLVRRRRLCRVLTEDAVHPFLRLVKIAPRFRHLPDDPTHDPQSEKTKADFRHDPKNAFHIS
jgi:hypothetical protein